MNSEELLQNMTLPVIVAPMFIVSGSKLVIESCKNGLLGTLPSLNGRTADEFEQLLIEITAGLREFEEETGIKPAPYGVNLIVNKTNPRLMTDLAICRKYKVPLIITSLGAIKEVVDAVHSYGGLVFHDVIKKRHAEKAIASGVDGIIAVTNGAGGHAGTANPFALVKEIRSFYDGTLVLAGSMSTGRDILAAQTMGADLIYMGTKFIATEESLAPQDYKNMLVTAHIDDIVYTDAVSGVHANFLLSSLTKSRIDVTQKKDEDFSKLSGGKEKAWKDIWSAGHGVAGIDIIAPVQEVCHELRKDYKAALLEHQRKIKLLKYS